MTTSIFLFCCMGLLGVFVLDIVIKGELTKILLIAGLSVALYSTSAHYTMLLQQYNDLKIACNVIKIPADSFQNGNWKQLTRYARQFK